MKRHAEPIELFEVGEADAGCAASRCNQGFSLVARVTSGCPVGTSKHSLPAERNSFVNRRETRAELARPLGRRRGLVSVLGSAAPARRAWSRRFGWSWLGDFPGGAGSAICPVPEPGRHRATRSVRRSPFRWARKSRSPQLGNAIAARGRCLVILDNFEQVSRWPRKTLGRWLNRASSGVRGDHARGAGDSRERRPSPSRDAAGPRRCGAVRGSGRSRPSAASCARRRIGRPSIRWLSCSKGCRSGSSSPQRECG